jgi:hypothetical protein
VDLDWKTAIIGYCGASFNLTEASVTKILMIRSLDLFGFGAMDSIVPLIDATAQFGIWEFGFGIGKEILPRIFADERGFENRCWITKCFLS